MKKKIILFLVIFLLLGLGFLGIVAVTFKMPEFAGMDEIALHDMEHGDLQATITARIFNPNFFALGAAKVDYVVSYRDTVIGKGELPQGLSLAASDTTPLELPVAMNLNGIFAVHKSMLRKAKCKLDIHLNGEFTFLHYRHGLDLQVEIEPEKFIQQVLGKSMGSDGISLEEMHWKSSKIDESTIEFVTLVKNPLDISLNLKSLDIKLYAETNQSLAGEWKLEKSLPLKPQYSTRMPGSMTLHHLAATMSVIGGVFRGEMKFDAKGMMIVELADLPFEIPIEGQVIVDARTGKGRWE
jgi:LEA14-like dessication related protein